MHNPIAFPMHYTDSPESDHCGMTLRDYLAAQCMPETSSMAKWADHTLKTMAENAYAMADAMLKAREAKS